MEPDVSSHTATPSPTVKATVRLRDVAEHAGVSPATASRTLNGDARVDAELRERVLASVATLGYRRNMLARNLRLRRVDQIGVVVSDIRNPHFGEMIKVVEAASFQRGHRVVICGTDESADKQATYLRLLAEDVSRSDPVDLRPGHAGDRGITGRGHPCGRLRP